MLLAENVIIDLGEDYVKQSYRNRYNIYTAQGKLSLSVPVTKPDGNHTSVHRVQLSDHEPWQRTHFRTIEAAYQNSPFYIHYIDEVRDLIYSKFDTLAEFNDHCFKGICKLIEIPLSWSFTNIYYEDECVDMRNIISPKKETKISEILGLHTYHQVFEEKHGFIKDLSILDIIFNMGPDGYSFIKKVAEDYRNAAL